MKNFVIFNKQKGEKTNAYSLVSEVTLLSIPKNIILKIVKVEDKLYSKEELEILRNKNI